MLEENITKWWYKTQEEAPAERNDIGVEYDLVNNLGFNLCVASQSPVMRWSRISEWREVVREEGLKEMN